ncbi:hypothetical protein [Achromobacter xylosoxidans]|jgi:hypothetical protein|uniref:hypothetical protein n=1 Tax=Alcaligenes xylosoxydans xylosoxydans TaxID=85698 RepID=UPI003B99DB4F
MGVIFLMILAVATVYWLVGILGRSSPALGNFICQYSTHIAIAIFFYWGYIVIYGTGKKLPTLPLLIAFGFAMISSRRRF